MQQVVPVPDDLGRRPADVAETDQPPETQPKRPRPARDFLRLPDRDEPVHRVERVRPEEDRRPAPTRTEPEETHDAHEKDELAARPAEDPVETARKRRRRLVILAVVALIVLAIAAVLGWYWYTTWRWLESTDDAYTQADNTVIAPKVAGYVSQLLVADNQAVKAGQLLLRIDGRDFQAALDQANADVQSAEANIGNTDAQIAMQQAVIAQARADIASAQAALTFAQQEYARYQELVRTGTGTVQRAQQAAADLRDKSAGLQHNQATLDQATKQVAVLKSQRGVAEAGLAHNRAVVEQAKLNLGYTAIASPIDGAVGDRSVQVGQYVQPGAQLMTIVPLGANIYVVANFKETQIRRMFRGESVNLEVDIFPGVHMHGVVDSLAPGSGAQFALLPPENATGNFTKIVQRVPVKIVIDPADNPIIGQLRPGLSVTATVDLRTAPPAGTPTLEPRNGAVVPPPARR